MLILKVSRRDFARRNIAARLIYCPWRGLGPPEYQPRLPVSARSHSSPHSHADQQPSRRDPSARFNSAAPSAFLPNPHSRPSSSLDRPGKDVAFYKHTGGGVMTAYEVGLLSSKTYCLISRLSRGIQSWTQRRWKSVVVVGLSAPPEAGFYDTAPQARRTTRNVSRMLRYDRAETFLNVSDPAVIGFRYGYRSRFHSYYRWHLQLEC